MFIIRSSLPTRVRYVKTARNLRYKNRFPGTAHVENPTEVGYQLIN